MFAWLISPQRFFVVSGRVIPWFAALCGVACCAGALSGLWLAPPDYQQGDAYRIMFLHVPAAMLSLLVYTFMSGCAAVFLIWRIKIAAILMRESAALGALFTLITLVTGSVWGKPMWGTWWIWDARLTSELILLFIYMGIMILQSSFPNQERYWILVAVWVLIGFVDIPIIHFSVQWWSTLHQGYTVTALAKPKIFTSMLYPLIIMWLAFFSYFVAALLFKSRHRLLLHEKRSSWVKKIAEI